MYGRYVLKRLANGIFVFVVLVFIYSVLFNKVAEANVSTQVSEMVRSEASRQKNMTAAQLQEWQRTRTEYLLHTYHLDQPFMTRVLWRTLETITLKFGNSSHMTSSLGDREVWKIIMEAMPKSMLIFTTAMVFEILFGVWLGLKKAQKPGGLLDRTTSIGTMVVYGMPTWWLAMLLIMLLVYIVPIFPSGGMHSTPPRHGFAGFVDLLYHMSLPLLTLLLIQFWGVALLSRNIVLGILQDDYIMAARARGLPERRVLFGHTLRTAAPPIVTIALLSLLSSVFGSIVFEGIFSWPGMGNLYWIALEQSDVPVILGLLAVTTGLYIAGLVLLDLVYGFLDPRIKAGGRA
jgi:peptide/nickel transport system permease protein